MTTVFFNIREGQSSNAKAIKEAFNLPDGSYELKITKRSKRSLTQNAFFHAILPDIQAALYDAGWRNVKSPLIAKRFVKELFLTVEEENELTGEKIKYVRDTSDLSKKEMADFIDEIIQWAAEYLSLAIFSPNEQSRFDYAR